MKKLILFTAILSIYCCSPDEKNKAATARETALDFAVFNAEGQDLLDPNNPNSYQEEDIKIFYMVDGELVEVMNEKLDHPRNFFIYKHDSNYVMRVFPNENKAEEITTTIVQWNQKDSDTIKSSFRRWNASIQVTKAWYNNENMLEGLPEMEHYYIVVK